MKNIMLHIGMPKTGTTTLQFALDANRGVLAKHGWLYPKTGVGASPHQKGHNDLVRAVKENDSGLFEKLVDEIERSAHTQVVVSSEEFMALGVKGIGFVKEALSGYGVKVVVYLREQASYMESLYNQAVKTGCERRDRHEFLAEMMCANRLNYYMSVKGWASAFGKDNVIVRKYEAELGGGEFLIRDFMGCLGLDGVRIEVPHKMQNRSIDNKYIEFLRVLNKIGIDQEIKNEKIVSVLLSGCNRVSGSGSKVYGDAERKLIRNYCRTSNRMLVKEYLGGGSDDLFHQNDAPAHVAPEILTSEVLAEVVSLLVVKGAL